MHRLTDLALMTTKKPPADHYTYRLTKVSADLRKITKKTHPSLHTHTQMLWLILLTYASELYHWIIYSKNLHTSTHTYTPTCTHTQTSTGKNRNAPIRLPVTFPTLYHTPLCSTLHIHPNGRPASDTMISKTTRGSKQVQQVPGERQQRWLGNTGYAKTGDTGACCTGTPLSFAAQQTVFCKYTNTRAVLSESHHNTQTHP